MSSAAASPKGEGEDDESSLHPKTTNEGEGRRREVEGGWGVVVG